MSVRLLGLDLADLDIEAAASILNARAADAPFSYVVTPNADHFVFLARKPELMKIYQQSLMCLLDSRVVALLARKFGLTTPHVTTGSDLTAFMLRSVIHPDEPITIIGLKPEWLPDLINRYHLTNVSHIYPPFGFENNTKQIQEIVQFVLEHPSRFTLLAVGSPRGEKLAATIAANGSTTGIGLCIGASLDFLSGHIRRAPSWVQHLNMEWLFRLITTPRLARRYLIDCPAVIPMLFRESKKT